MEGRRVSTTEPLQVPASLAYPDEVVTHAYVRRVELPGGVGSAALVTVDNGLDHRRPTTFGPAGLANLAAALDEAAGMADIVAVAVTGKPFVFAVGADLSGVGRVGDADAALALGQLGHAVFARLGSLAVPTFAFVNGAAMGGGLELALHADYRTLSAGAAALSLPECSLGLVPGWGGATLLPQLVGAAAAVGVIIDNALSQNRQLRPDQALSLGVVDAVFEPADFLERSLAWAAGVVAGTLTPTRRPVDTSEEAWAAALAAGHAAVDARTHGCAPAPARALALIDAARTATRQQGFAAEDQALADMVMSDEMRASLYAFDLVQKRAKRPAGAPDAALARPVTAVGVLGAGLMASQLAMLVARRCHVPVVMRDLDDERVARGLGYVEREIAQLATKGRIGADEANRLRALVTGTTDLADLAEADVVIEAVFEELAVKQAVLAELEAVLSPTAVILTNTSSLSVTAMASVLEHPQRMAGLHFFNPVAVLPLVEIARTPHTDEGTLATVFALARQLRKSAVLVADSPAFVFNRLVTAAMAQVLQAVDEGSSFADADAAVGPLGLPMAPLALLRLVGPGVAAHTGASLAAAFGTDRFPASRGLAALVAAGLGGVYLQDGTVDPRAEEAWQRGDSPVPGPEILRRAAVALATEIDLLLAEGVVSAAADVDLCLLLGGGWAFWNGGITPYLDRTGVAEAVTGHRFHAPGVASLAR